MKIDERAMKRLFEKRMDTRKRTNREFLNSLEIVRDHKKVKNIRRRQGVPAETNDELCSYGDNYTKAFGHTGAKNGSTGSYTWDADRGKFVKISDDIPSGKLVTL